MGQQVSKQIVNENVEYKDASGFLMEGFVARDVSITTPQPLVIIAPDWTGCTDVAKERAKYFADLGYIGFVADLYGKGNRGEQQNHELNSSLMNKVLENRRANIVGRLTACVMAAKSRFSITKVMMIGFCFGGLCVLDFARSGSDEVAGVVSVHGLLGEAEPKEETKIKTKVMMLHGYLDPMATPQNLAEYHEEMSRKGAVFQTVVFGQSSHAFTNPTANLPEKGIQYDERSDKWTWAVVEEFMRELF